MLYFGTCPGASQAGTSPLLWIIGRIAWTQTNNFILKVKGLLPTVALAYRLLLSRPHAPDVSHLKPFQDSLELYYNVLCLFLRLLWQFCHRELEGLAQIAVQGLLVQFGIYSHQGLTYLG